MGYAVKLQAKEILHDTEPLAFGFTAWYSAWSESARTSAFVIYCKGFKRISARVYYLGSDRGVDIYTANNGNSDGQYTTNYPINNETFIGYVITTTYVTYNIPNDTNYLYITRKSVANGVGSFGWYILHAS